MTAQRRSTTAALLTLVALAAPARADHPLPDYPYKGFAIDVGTAVSFPTADSNYVKFAEPAFKLALHVGWELVVERRFLITPEFTFDYVPVNTKDSTYQDNHLDANFNRIRGLVGARFLVRVGVGEIFARIAFGVDYLAGTIATPVLPIAGALTQHYSSTAFGFEPGIGAQFTLVKHLVAGLMLSFPLAGHDFGSNKIVGNASSFTAFDIDLAAFLGARL